MLYKKYVTGKEIDANLGKVSYVWETLLSTSGTVMSYLDEENSWKILYFLCKCSEIIGKQRILWTAVIVITASNLVGRCYSLADFLSSVSSDYKLLVIYD